jgi:hypothetical protein
MQSPWATPNDQRIGYSEACPLCAARGTWDTMPHEPWCPHFMRTVDETDGRQLTIETED